MKVMTIVGTTGKMTYAALPPAGQQRGMMQPGGHRTVSAMSGA